jgi:uncharacterized membrane protein YcjF (UPF0283 family)
MGPIAKMFIGVLLMVGSVVAVVATLDQPGIFNLWQDFLTVLLGAVPALVFLIGVFIVWLEWDELRIERELAKEEEEEKKREKEKRAKKKKE